MPGDLWAGYLQAQAADVAETEREEDKKRRRLQDQLQKLNMESLRRTIDRDAQKWEIEKTAGAERDKLFSALEGFLSPEQMAVFRLGGDLSEFQGVTEERYLPTADEIRDAYLIETGQKAKAGGGSTRSASDRETAERYSKIPEDQRTPFQRKFLKKYFEGTRGATKAIGPSGTGISELDEALMESGATFDPASGAFISIPEGMGGLENLDFGAIGQQPAGTVTEEDEFIEEARGKKIDWDLVAKDHPDWNIFYIKQKLGVNE